MSLCRGTLRWAGAVGRNAGGAPLRPLCHDHRDGDRSSRRGCAGRHRQSHSQRHEHQDHGAIDEAGVYAAQLKEGDYSLPLGAGFKESVVQNVVLRARDYRRIDIHLEVGGLETKVEVTAGQR